MYRPSAPSPGRRPRWPGLLCLLCSLCLWLSACQCVTADVPSPTTASADVTPLAGLAASTKVLTLPADTDQDPPASSPLYPTAAMDPTLPYDRLVITSFYAAGRVAGKGVCDASYVEIYNNSNVDLPLSGVALYLSWDDLAYVELDFAPSDRISAGQCFLVRLDETRAVPDPVLTVAHYDAVMSATPEPRRLRLALGAAGKAPDPSLPMAESDHLFAYASAHPLDADDVYHYVKKLSTDKMARKKADTDKTDYQTIDLTEASSTVLAQITPRSSAGRVNTDVHSRIDEVVFSAPGGVYAQGFDLTMTAPEGYTIYYTVNSPEPRHGTFDIFRGIMTYDAPLHLNSTEEMTWGPLTKDCGKYLGSRYDPLASTFPGAACVRAYAVRASDGATTPLTTQTYFIGETYASWAMDMVNVAVIPEEFIGTNGIYPCNQPTHEHISAYVEFFSPAGAEVFAGWSEIAMNGRGSLGMSQKSFRILLKSDPMGAEDVEENLNTLNYDLFGDYANVTPDGERITWYRHILLRNGGGDNTGCTISRSHIGDAYIQRIDRYLAPDDMAYAPVMVFINGEFFGLFNARDRLDTKYFTGKYGIPEEDFSMLECPYPLTYGWNVDYMAAYGDPAQADEFNQMVRYIKTHNMALSKNYAYACERIDIDGLIDFFCAQIYLCCSDWPGNNIKVWRNTNPQNGMDTKWHFCIVDTDHGVGLNSTLETNLFGVINDGSIMGAIVNHLMESPAFRQKFIRRFVWCTEVYFAPARMTVELDVLVGRIQPVMQLQLDRWRVTNGSRTTYDTWWSYIEVIRHFVTHRQSYAKNQLKNWAGIDDAAWEQYLREGVALWGDRVE